jgi:hypothetical protein
VELVVKKQRLIRLKPPVAPGVKIISIPQSYGTGSFGFGSEDSYSTMTEYAIYIIYTPVLCVKKVANSLRVITLKRVIFLSFLGIQSVFPIR